MSAVYVIGVGMTPFGRLPQETVRTLSRRAVEEALADAGLEFDAVQSVAFANSVQGAMEGQYGIRGQAALQDFPCTGRPIVNVENACASASTAFNLAVTQIRAGAADIALAVGAEKMTGDDPARSMAAFEGSWDRATKDHSLALLDRMARHCPAPQSQAAREGPRTVFMDIYAAFARYHMGRFGTTQRQIAAVSAKNHRHSVDNPRAQYRRSFTLDEVLESRPIAWPLTLPMCAPISDGAAAAVLCSERALARLGGERALKVRASVLMSGGRTDYDALDRHVARQAANSAYAAAGLGPEDLDVVECHDATAFGEIQQCELLGLCPLGEGGPFAESGATTMGGKVPFNPSGGLESKGHPIGATGLGQICELSAQLRGEAGSRQTPGARIGLAENGGGLMGIEEAAVGITILERAGST